MSSLHARSVPVPQLPLRTYTTVSNPVALPLQVEIVAVPDSAGVHVKTCSGDVSVDPQLPWSALVPVVVPFTTPPAAGIAIGAPQVPLPGVAVAVGVAVAPPGVAVAPFGVAVGPVGTALGVGRVIATATSATLFVSESSAMRWKGSIVTRSVYVPDGTPVMSRYWHPSCAPYVSEQPAVMPWFVHV